jgi:hypothetical protein
MLEQCDCQALPDDKKEEYQLEDIAKDIDETAAKAIEDAENKDLYKNQLDAPTQEATKEKAALIAIQQKLVVDQICVETAARACAFCCVH